MVWIPKYRKPVLTGDIAIRVRDLIRQIAMEHELEIISGKVASDYIHVFLSYRAHQCEISFFGATQFHFWEPPDFIVGIHFGASATNFSHSSMGLS